MTQDTSFINYLNAQVILIGAREGKDTINKELGIDIEEERSGKSSDIIKKLNMRKGQIPIKPITEGILE